MTAIFHPLQTDIRPSEGMNNPFDYEPHPLCVEAAGQVRAYLGGHPEWAEELAAGMMLGVLVCRDAKGQLGFLAAYSGQLGGREDWPWFVPAVFDYLQPDGYFKREEAEITAINHRIDELEQSPEYVALQRQLAQLRMQAEQETEAYRQLMAEAKARRDRLRQAGQDSDELIRESQFQKAELRRLRQRWNGTISETEEQIKPMESAVSALRQERRERSDALQRWLFDQFLMLNEHGERRTLTDIFAQTPQRVPPSGAGECCAPKLLQYAFANGLQPVCMAEFWNGRSPKAEVRHHGQYYPACRGKCKPILEWMMDSKASPSSSKGPEKARLPLVELGESFIVVNKPAGLLSVPGRTGEESVESLLRQQYGQVYMVHRLDQDTSGLLVVALTEDAYHALQRQFLARVVYKRYIALLDGEVHGRGTISLPLRPALLDRPRQVVDHEHGKEAVTDYEVLGREGACTRIALTPHTGRTHQLRMHCAHAEGLGCPIIGDRLYGKPAQRLCLHAAELAFNHPLTGERLHFTSPVPF
ncbi:MAG: RluA family pseudouridine synthase [Prevotella sp.]|nr:RluA family pseudouridine synthase [Prevotella sp.]